MLALYSQLHMLTRRPLQGSQMYGRSPTFKLYTLRVGCMNDCPEKTIKPMGASFPERLPDWIEKLPSMMTYPNVVEYFMSFMKK